MPIYSDNNTMPFALSTAWCAERKSFWNARSSELGASRFLDHPLGTSLPGAVRWRPSGGGVFDLWTSTMCLASAGGSHLWILL